MINSKLFKFISKVQLFSAVVLAFAAFGETRECTYDFDGQCSVAVSNFQVPLLLSEGKCGFTYEGFADSVGGSDLRVATQDGTPLPFEIENWNPKGTSVVWVKVPEFSGETKLKLSWGDKDASIVTVEKSAFWDNALGVFHFGDIGGLNSANGEVFNAKYGNVRSDAVSPVGTSAKFERDGVYVQENAKGEIYFPEDLNTFTVSFWLKTDKRKKATDQTYLFQMGHAFTQTMNTQIAFLLNWHKDNGCAFYWHSSVNGSWGVNNMDLTFPNDDAWHHIACSYDGSKFSAYCDGKFVYEKEFSGFSIKKWVGEDGNFIDGHFSLGGTSGNMHKLDGQIDEFRFERVCRSADWIKATAETQVLRYSKMIPFSDYDGEKLVDFPAYIHLDRNLGLNIKDLYEDLRQGRAHIYDLRTNALLPYEIEYVFTNNFDNSCGIWVRMPQYSSQDGVFIEQRVMNDNFSVVSTPNKMGSEFVWNGKNDVLVFHMNPTGRLYNAVNGITLEAYSSNNTDNNKSTGSPLAVQGPTGPYQAYISRTNSVQRADSHSVSLVEPLTNRWTISWWAKEDADEFANAKPETYLWSIGTIAALKGSGYKTAGADANKISLWKVTNGKYCNLEIPDTQWHHYAYAADGTSVYSYRDGVFMQKRDNASYNFNCLEEFNGNVYLMSSSNPNKDAFRGCADEFRLESEFRTGDWIKASYLNQLAWRDGVPWQFAPHFAGISNDIPQEDGFNVKAKLSCRTTADVTVFWGVADGGEDPQKWENSKDVGSFKDMEEAVAAIENLSPGIRYAYRFRAANNYGTAWSQVCYATIPIPPRRGKMAKISISYEGDETLNDFPLCVRIPASNDLPQERNSVRFYDEKGRELAWEAELWNPEGESVVWVRVPELTSQSALTMRFGGNFPVNSVWTADLVWRPDEHASTWHFGALKDSIVYTVDSSSYGAKITSHWATPFAGQAKEPFAYVTNGVAGEAFHFPRLVERGAFASKNKVEINDFRSGFTFSVWLQILDTEDDDAVEQVFVKNELTDRFGLPSDTYIQYHVCYKPKENQVYFRTYAHKNTLYPMFSGEIAPIINSAFSVDRPDDQWHYYSFVSDGMNLYAYRDGVCIKSRWWPLVLNGGALPNKNILISFGNAVNQYNLAHGSIDEYRAERVGRSAAWIKACYDNQKQGSSFVTVGGTYASGMVIVVR